MARICCLGVGTIGRSWALVFSRAGYEVQLFDSAPAVAVRAKQRLLEELRGTKGDGVRAEQIDELVRPCSKMTEALMGVEYVQESITEDAMQKRQLFIEVSDVVSAECVLASSTSEIPLSRFSYDVRCQAQMVVAHPINPPHLIPVVEVAGGPWTNPKTLERCLALQRAIGQEPIVLHRELDGYVVNRLQFALIGEALKLIAAGHCSVHDIDKAIKDGLGRRWSFMGPFETAHLNSDGGFIDYVRKFRPIIERLLANVSPGAPLDDQSVRSIHNQLLQLVPLEMIPQRQVWRNEKLLGFRTR